MSHKSSKSTKKKGQNQYHKLKKSYKKLDQCTQKECGSKPEKDLKCAEEKCAKEFDNTIKKKLRFLVDSLEVSSRYNQLYVEIINSHSVLTDDDQKEFCKYVCAGKSEDLLKLILEREKQNQKALDDILCVPKGKTQKKSKKSKKSKKGTKKRKGNKH